MGSQNDMGLWQYTSDVLDGNSVPHRLQDKFLPLTLGKRRHQLLFHVADSHLPRTQLVLTLLRYNNQAAAGPQRRHREDSITHSHYDSCRRQYANFPDFVNLAHLGLPQPNLHLHHDDGCHLCDDLFAGWQNRYLTILGNYYCHWHV